MNAKINADMMLFPKPVKAWKWDCSRVTEFRKMGIPIRPHVYDNGNVAYYLGDVYLSGEMYIVEQDGVFKAMQKAELEKKYTL